MRLPLRCIVFLPVVFAVLPVICILLLPVVFLPFTYSCNNFLPVVLVIGFPTRFALGSESMSFLVKLRERFGLFASGTGLHLHR